MPRWLVLLLVGCSAPVDTEPPLGMAPVDGCAAGELATETGCCRAGELPGRGGTCIPAGVPPWACAPGFTSDGRGGCEPTIPTAACGPGTMAVPGEGRCRRLAPCGAPKWGSLPVDPTTEYVDGAYRGTDSDGSEQKPWRTIEAGVQAAAPGALVAVAAGSYAEQLLIADKPVRLRGRCPEMVELVGGGGEAAALFVLGGASGSEIGGLAIRGSNAGLVVDGAEDVLVEQVWIHDTGHYGLAMQSTLGPTSAQVRGSLVESAAQIGVFVSGAAVTVDQTVVRDTRSAPDGTIGRGLEARTSPVTMLRGEVTLRRCLLELQRDVGVLAAGADVRVEGSVVRDMLGRPDGIYGRALAIGPDATAPEVAPGRMWVRGSLVDRGREYGAFARGGELVMENTVVRAIAAVAGGDFGRAVGVQHDVDLDVPASAVVRHSLIEAYHQLGFVADGATAVLEGVIVRDPLPTGGTGRGVQAQGPSADETPPAAIALRGSVVERNRGAALFFVNAEVQVQATLLGESAADEDGLFGDGIAAVALATPIATTATVASSAIRSNVRAGISSFGATIALSDTLLDCNAIALNGESTYAFVQEEPIAREFRFEDGGGNDCGCGAERVPCAAESSGLAPPPIELD